MSAGRPCSRHVVFASTEESVRTTARRMAEHNVGVLVAPDDERRPAGVISDRDIAIRCVAEDGNPDTMTVWDAMTRVHPIGEDSPIEGAEMIGVLWKRELPLVHGG